MRLRLALVPLLLLPWFDARPVDAADEEDHGVAIQQEVFPIAIRYRIEIQLAVESFPPVMDVDAHALLFRPLASGWADDCSPAPELRGPRRLALLMSFQT